MGEFCGTVSCECSFCDPNNNACFATKAAEMWDPDCPAQAWVEVGEQESPRMYHSTALLLPDGRVLSMGGGHVDFSNWAVLEEHPVSEYFEPQYSENQDAPRPTVSILGSSEGTQEAFLPWDGWLRLEVDNGVEVGQASLVRLGSTTHGFDQDQRFVPLILRKLVEFGPDVYSLEFQAPAADAESIELRHIAPPGYYMFFLISDVGQPSLGAYVRVGETGTSPGYDHGDFPIEWSH